MCREMIEAGIYKDNLPAAAARFGLVMRPLRQMPKNQPRTTFHQRALSTVDEEYIEKEISTWLKEGVVSKAYLLDDTGSNVLSLKSQGYRVVTWLNAVFTIPKKGSTKERRFIMDCREQNQYFELEPRESPRRSGMATGALRPRVGSSFKIENLNDYTLLAEKNWFGAVIDLASGYWQLGLREETARLMGWQFRGELYRFEVLVFGHHLAPELFTRQLAAVMAWLRDKGVVCLIYLDDLLVLANSAENLQRSLRLVMELFDTLGAKISVSKSCTTPSQSFTWLGVVIDTQRFRFFVPEEKRAKIVKAAVRLRDDANRRRPTRVAVVAKLVGRLVAMERACRKLRFVVAVLMNWLDGAWDRSHDRRGKALASLGEVEADGLHLLATSLERWCSEGSPITYGGELSSGPSERIYTLNTDASLEGFGVCLKPSGESMSGRWSEEPYRHLPTLEERTSYSKDPDWHISLRELQAFQIGLEHWGSELRGKKVRPMVDSAATSQYIRKGRGSSPTMTQVALCILETALRYEILLLPPRWVPSALNEEADQLSRSIRVHDWTMTDLALQRIENHFGMRVTYDRFATRENRKTELYDSLEESRDAFVAADWVRHENLVVAPFALIGRILNLMREHKASGILVAPVWPRKPWWATLRDMTRGQPGLMLNPREDFVPEPLTGCCEPWKAVTHNWRLCAYRILPEG